MSPLPTAKTWMLPVFAYGSQLARILHHAYSDGMMATTQRDDERHGVLQNAFHASEGRWRKPGASPPRGYWSQHLRAAACPCGNNRLGSLRRAIRWIFYDFRWNGSQWFRHVYWSVPQVSGYETKNARHMALVGRGDLDMERTVGKTERKDGECCHMTSGIGLGDNGGMTIATPERYAQMLDAARRGVTPIPRSM